MSTSTNIRLALDMYVLGQGVKTGVYRVCDELFPRLARSSKFAPRYFMRKGFETNATAYIAAHQLPGSLHTSIENTPSEDADILLSPFGVAPLNWLDDPNILHAHIIYDLIAIRNPGYFTLEASTEVHNIISSLNESSIIFAISEFTKQDLLSYRPDLKPNQVTVIPLAAGDNFKPCHDKEEKNKVRVRYGIPSNVPYILSLATLEIRKNLHQVVNAFIRYLDQNSESQLHLVLSGMTGWKLDQLNHALDAAGIWRNRIILTGFVEDSDLSALYSAAICFVCLSRHEGFGLPPLEAMACGTPVICSNNSSLPEVVGQAGLMFDADDIEGVAKAIQKIISSEGYRAELSAMGIKRATQFDWDKCANIVAVTLCESHNMRARIPDQFQQMTANGIKHASYMGYENGSKGPVFSRPHTASENLSQTTWPTWINTLPVTAENSRPEGGLRMQGRFKIGTPTNPLITYITVVRNNTATLERTIKSVQQQTYSNVEHIILDGASTDETLGIIMQYADKLDYFVSEPDSGLYDALNKSVPLARGQLICILNSDDWLEPNAAEIVARHMGAGESNSLLLSAAKVREGEIIHDWPPAFVHPGSYFMCANACHNAIYATRIAYENSGPYDSSYKIAADFKWIMSCLDAGAVFTYTKESTVNYSLGGTSSDFLKHSLECMKVVQERYPFLSPQEVRGLYHCFFVFSSTTTPYMLDRPDNFTYFLRDLFAKNNMRTDFLNALSWASIVKLDHPADRHVDQHLTELKEAVKKKMKQFPALYRLTQRLYLLLFRN